MVNLEFWSAMAGVSGVFAGLLSVGLSLCLDNIRTASRELAKLNMKEQSSRLMFSSMLSSLIFFVLPLIASLSLLAQSKLKTSIPFWVSMLICLLLLAPLFYVHEHMKTRRQVKSVLSVNIGRSKKLLQCQFEGVKYLLYLIVVAHAGLMFAIWMGWPPGEEVLKGVAIFSLAAGLSGAIVGLSIFDINNIIFQVSDELGRFVDHGYRHLTKNVDKCYEKYEELLRRSECKERLSQKVQELSGGIEEKKSVINEQIRDEQDRIRSSYKEFREDVRSFWKAESTRQLFDTHKHVTFADIEAVKSLMENLSQKRTSVEKSSEGAIDFLERLMNP